MQENLDEEKISTGIVKMNFISHNFFLTMGENYINQVVNEKKKRAHKIAHRDELILS